MFRSRQISLDIRYLEAKTHQGKVYSVRKRCREMLPPEIIPRTILRQELCPQFRIAFELQASTHLPIRFAADDLTIGTYDCRYHTVQEFNKGVYDYIIASDESAGKGEHDEEEEDADAPAQEDEEECEYFTLIDTFLAIEPVLLVVATQRKSVGDDGTETGGEPSSSKRKRESDEPVSSKSKKRKRGRKATDTEYGVSRGVDFVDVSCVINFDLPSSSRAYTHRVGRTARAGRTGMSLSFVVPQNEFGKNKVVGGVESTKHDEKVFARIEKEQAARGSKIKEYKFDMKQVEAFRYRMEDALRSVTRAAIKEARVKELKTEILNSDKLKV